MKFIGSNLLETLLKLNQKVVGLDNFFSGHAHNLDEVKNHWYLATNGKILHLWKGISGTQTLA